jgi:versiconal hemiacetal acetate esterase
MRDQFAGLYAALAPNYPPAPDAVSVMNGSHEGIKYRVYFPKNASKLLPVGVYAHGGGLVLGDLDTEDMLCQAFVEQAETILVSVDYRLAPEHPHPAQLDDTIKILEWVMRLPIYFIL